MTPALILDLPAVRRNQEKTAGLLRTRARSAPRSPAIGPGLPGRDSTGVSSAWPSRTEGHWRGHRDVELDRRLPGRNRDPVRFLRDSGPLSPCDRGRLREGADVLTTVISRRPERIVLEDSNKSVRGHLR